MANNGQDPVEVLEAIPSSQPEVQGDSSSYAEEQKKLLFDYQSALVVMQKLVNDWREEIRDTENRRKTRDVEIDVKALRDTGKLDKDETIIPVRVIDTNIQRDIPPYINYIKNSRRIGIFGCISDPERETTKLELEFTRVATYNGWETPHYKVVDGGETHGWDAVEVVFDDSKPGKFSIEHIGHDMLFFPMNGKDIQDSGEVIRAYDLTSLQLKSFVYFQCRGSPRANH